MAGNNDSGQDRNEEATPERREEFRGKGQVAFSKEIVSVGTLLGGAGFLLVSIDFMRKHLQEIFSLHFFQIRDFRISLKAVDPYFQTIWLKTMMIMMPMLIATSVIAIGVTFLQTQMNWSWKKLAPDFKRLNPITGLGRMVNAQAAVELIKGIVKMVAVGVVGTLILYSERIIVPGLLYYPMESMLGYWSGITLQMIWAVGALMLVVSGGDYLFNFFQLEKQMKMTKQEVKEEYKRKELDPHVKGRMRKMARDLANRKMLSAVESATVVITNPTHYSVALKYEPGMVAPMVVAKGVDFLALRIRERAKEFGVVIMENPPLARLIYRDIEVDQEIPENLYKAIAEIIKSVYRKKGYTVPQRADS